MEKGYNGNIISNYRNYFLVLDHKLWMEILCQIYEKYKNRICQDKRGI